LRGRVTTTSGAMSLSAGKSHTYTFLTLETSCSVSHQTNGNCIKHLHSLVDIIPRREHNPFQGMQPYSAMTFLTLFWLVYR